MMAADLAAQQVVIDGHGWWWESNVTWTAEIVPALNPGTRNE
jgi:hypothetical protein